MSEFKIIALCGKAGSGKDTLMQKTLESYPDKFNEIISCTTRPSRENEINGKNYHFLSVQEFTKRLLNGDLIEATEFNNWHYGTLLSSLSKDKINIGVFNLDSIICLQDNSNIDLTTIYITCSDKTRLIRQLAREQNPDVAEIIRRYNSDEKDFKFMKEEIHEYLLFNNENFFNLDEFIKFIGRLC